MIVKRLIRYLLGLSVGTKVVIVVVIVGLGIFVFTYFEPHKLFIDEVVDEDFPAPVAIATTTTAAEDHCGDRGAHHRASGHHRARRSGNNGHHLWMPLPRPLKTRSGVSRRPPRRSRRTHQ